MEDNSVSPCCEVQIISDGDGQICENCGQVVVPEYGLTAETIRLTDMLRQELAPEPQQGEK